MAFKTSTMLHWVSSLAPALYHQFREIYQAIGTRGEAEVVREVYRQLKPINFSKEFLEPMVKSYPSSLIALPVRDLLWSDWGTASRIRDVLKKTARLKQPKGYRAESKILNAYRTLGSFALNDFDKTQEMKDFCVSASNIADLNRPSVRWQIGSLSIYPGFRSPL